MSAGARLRSLVGAARAWLLAPVVLVLGLTVLALHGTACEPQGGEVVVDPALVAFLSKARAAHHRADIAEGDGDRKAAIEALSSIIEGPLPRTSPEVVEVVADTRARRADLRSQEGDFDGARRDVDDGLASAVAITHFRGHLYEVGGLIAERRAAALEKAGDGAGAKLAKEQAIGLYEKAIEVQDRVIREALDEADESVRRK